jgi:hypothetical protein
MSPEAAHVPDVSLVRQMRESMSSSLSLSILCEDPMVRNKTLDPEQNPLACRPLAAGRRLAAVAPVAVALPAADVGGAHAAAAAAAAAGALGRAQPRVVRAEPGGAALLSRLKGVCGARKAPQWAERRLMAFGVSGGRVLVPCCATEAAAGHGCR